MPAEDEKIVLPSDSLDPNTFCQMSARIHSMAVRGGTYSAASRCGSIGSKAESALRSILPLAVRGISIERHEESRTHEPGQPLGQPLSNLLDVGPGFWLAAT